MLGITDGLSTIAQGISNEIGDTILNIPQIRPPRSFIRSTIDPTVKVLSNFSLRSCEAQEFIRRKSEDSVYIDDFICDISVTDDSDIIMSEQYVYWVKKEIESNYDNVIVLWSDCWSNIVCALLATPLVEVVLDDGNRVKLACGDVRKSKLVYNAFARNAHKVKEPGFMIPVSIT